MPAYDIINLPMEDSLCSSTGNVAFVIARFKASYSKEYKKYDKYPWEIAFQRIKKIELSCLNSAIGKIYLLFR